MPPANTAATKREPPHLLTLPREIRNIIYSHLTRSFTFKWTYGPTSGQGGYICAYLHPHTITVHNAPLLPMLLTHSRIHDEYKESEACTALRVSIAPPPLPHWMNDIGIPDIENLKYYEKRGPPVLKHARHAKVLVREVGWMEPEKLWSAVRSTVAALTQQAPKVHTIKLAVQNGTNDEVENERTPYPAFEAPGFMAAPPGHLTSFRLRHTALGYRLFVSQVFTRPWHEDAFPSYGAEMRLDCKLCVARYGCYVYRNGVGEKWSKEEVIEAFPVVMEGVREVGRGRPRGYIEALRARNEALTGKMMWREV